MSGKRYTVEIKDQRLIDLLESADNRSEIIRDGVRKLIKSDANDMEGLEEAHKTAFDWLEGRGLVSVDEAETSIAVQTQLDKKLVRLSVFEPLEEMGLIKVQPGMQQSLIKAIPPVECMACGADLPPNNVGDHMGQEHWGGAE